MEDGKNLLDIPDEDLQGLQFSMPWQYDPGDGKYVDPDGFTLDSSDKEDTSYTREALQIECWKKLHRNPQINTAIRGLVGRLTGLGFETTSYIRQIQEVIEEIELDPRNRLYNYFPKFVARNYTEGELFLCFTCHTDGFIEIDFKDPKLLNSGGDDDTGIFFHASKKTMPIFYNFKEDGEKDDIIPSIFVARYPEIVAQIDKHSGFDRKFTTRNLSRKKIYKQFGGYFRFIVSWDRGFLTRRATSYLRTVLEWINYYENLKKYEIDHKKSSGAYLWIFKINDAKSFKLWLNLSDEDRRKTGIMQKKTPGGSLVLPPGIDVDVKNPNLTAIREQDTDILHMITSGLNEPEDVSTGQSKGTFASVKASRGPMSDRVADEVSFWQTFLKYDFWGSIFFLKSKLTGFPETFKIKEADSFKSKKPVFKDIEKRPEQLIDIRFPTSEVVELEGLARAMLGVKHGPIAETLGIANEEIARRMGIAGYGKMRLRKATEDEKYPELEYNVDAEKLQELKEGETGKKTPKSKDKK